MYKVRVKREFVAQHFLIGGDWGDENKPHSHIFTLECILQGRNLDQHGYLFDISILEKSLDEIRSKYRDKLLNDIPEFSGLNPSVENFCRIISNQVKQDIGSGVENIEIRLWEEDNAWASFSEDIK